MDIELSNVFKLRFSIMISINVCDVWLYFLSIKNQKIVIYVLVKICNFIIFFLKLQNYIFHMLF